MSLPKALSFSPDKLLGMNDKDMALELGELVIKLQSEKDALEGVFTDYRVTLPDGRRVEIPFHLRAQQISEEPSFQQTASLRLQRLRDALRDTNPANSLNILHTHFLKK